MTSTVPINRDRLLDRFLRYVRIDTTANPHTEDYPSSPGQRELGRVLVDELQQMGASQVEQDRHGLVWATLPASPDVSRGGSPTVLLNAHLDTSPDAAGQGVRPQVIAAYAGGDIPLACRGQVITQAGCPALQKLIGHTLITTDGTTLLGGDDKAGVAVIMQVAQHLLENRQLPHGEVRILFTCDEEIGRGARHVDLQRAAAQAAYTLDGGGMGEIEAENFSADQLCVEALGNNIHPALGKGRMINAIRGLAQLLSQLPSDRLAPEVTEGREGFLHPYEISGGVSRAEAKILLRDFDTSQLDAYEELVRQAAAEVQSRGSGIRFQITRQRQYRNMADFIRPNPHVVELACQAWQALGKPWKLGAIRGGTDGAQFSEMGLPTPNLSVGQHNIHSPLEFVSLDQMQAAAEHLLQLLELWSHRGELTASPETRLPGH